MTYQWPEVPVVIRRAADRLVADLRETLGGNLVGVYLHGSLALGGFSPDHSDVDLLVVTGDQTTTAAKRGLLQMPLRASGDPVDIEISLVRRDQLNPWRHPTPFDLHFSESHRAEVERELKADDIAPWIHKPRVDADLAAHISVVRSRGVVLHGAEAGDVLPEVPFDDYLESVLADFVWIRDHGSEARSPSYPILNACRAWQLCEQRTVASKQEAGRWALPNLPESYRATVRAALEFHAGELAELAIPACERGDLIAYVGGRLEECPGRPVD